MRLHLPLAADLWTEAAVGFPDRCKELGWLLAAAETGELGLSSKKRGKEIEEDWEANSRRRIKAQRRQILLETPPGQPLCPN